MTAQDLLSMSRNELDDLFRKSPPGPVPDGRARGTAIVVPGSPLDGVVRGLIRGLVWRGKAFTTANGSGSLRNLISPLSLRLFEAKVYVAGSWFAPGDAVILDYSRSSFLVRKIRDEIRMVEPGLYLGQVYWGRRRLILFMLEFAGPAREPAGAEERQREPARGS